MLRGCLPAIDQPPFSRYIFIYNYTYKLRLYIKYLLTLHNYDSKLTFLDAISSVNYVE